MTIDLIEFCDLFASFALGESLNTKTAASECCLGRFCTFSRPGTCFAQILPLEIWQISGNFPGNSIGPPGYQFLEINLPRAGYLYRGQLRTPRGTLTEHSLRDLDPLFVGISASRPGFNNTAENTEYKE